MDNTVFLNPIHATGAVHLGAPLVLNDVPCPTCGGDRFNTREWVAGKCGRLTECPTCDASGSVSPSVQVGQRLAIATTRTDPDLRSDSPHMNGSWHWSWNKYPDRPGKTGARFDVETSAVLLEGVHLGSVVGSVTATTPALPIVDDPDFVPDQHGALLLNGEVDEDGWGLVFFKSTGVEKRLGEWLPWLGDDLVGRWAVLTDNPTVGVSACSRCGGWGDENGGDCYACAGSGMGAPVPLPDGVDHPAGTLIKGTIF